MAETKTSNVKWDMPDEQFPNLVAKIIDPNETVLSIINDPNFFIAFKKQHTPLLKYIINNVVEFAKIALNEILHIKHKYIFKIFITKTPNFSQKIAQSRSFIDYFSNFLLNSEVKLNLDQLKLFCTIGQFFASYSSGGFLTGIKDGQKFFEKLLEYDNYYCVQDFLNLITGDGHPYFAKFVEDTQSAKIIWEILLQQRNCEKNYLNYKYLANVLSSVSQDSQTLFYIAEKSRLSLIFDDVVNNESDLISRYAMDLIYELCSHCDDDDDSDESLFALVFTYLMERVDDLANYISNDRGFTLGKVRAIETIAGIVSMQEEFPESVSEAAGKLFTKIFEFPLFSILHCASVTLFGIVIEGGIDINSLLEKYEVRNKIIEAFKNKNRTHDKQFFGHLYKISEMIIELEEDEEDIPENWRDFVKGPFQEMKERIESNFGGPVPSRVNASKFNDDLI